MKAFTRQEDRLLAKYRSQGMYFYEVADLLGRSEREVRARFAVVPLPKKRMWAEDEIAFVKAHYGLVSTKLIGRCLRRKEQQVFACATRRGLSTPQKTIPPALHRLIRQKNKLGWSDQEITAAWNADHPELMFNRRSVQEHRRDKLGLPSNALSDHRRLRVAAQTREQLRHAGLPTLAAVRVNAFSDFATRSGWPGIKRPRLVQILNVLYERGPHTREKIAAIIGMPWKGSRKSLAGNGPGGSYLAELMRLKLVVRFPGRPVKGHGSGHSVHLYAIAPHVVRKLPALAVHQPERKVS